MFLYYSHFLLEIRHTRPGDKVFVKITIIKLVKPRCSDSPSSFLFSLRAAQEKALTKILFCVCYEELACQIIYYISCSSEIPSNLFHKQQRVNYSSFFLSFHLMNPYHHFFKNIWQFVVTTKTSVFTVVMSQSGNVPVFWHILMKLPLSLQCTFLQPWVNSPAPFICGFIYPRCHVDILFSVLLNSQQHSLWNNTSKWKLLLGDVVINMCAIYHVVGFF